VTQHTTYDHTTFTMDVVPKGFTEEMRTLVRFAVSHGWRVRPQGLRIVMLSVTGNKSITLSASGRNVPIRRHTRMIEQYGSPLVKPPDRKAPIEQSAKALADRMNLDEETARQRQTREAMQKIVAASTKTPPAPKTKTVTLVSEEPMIAHRGQGVGYPSTTTIERKWSDGSIDYACAKDGCDFVSTVRHGPRSHWQVHIREDEANRTNVDLIPKVDTEPHEPIYRPRQHRVAALAAALKELLQDGLDWDNLDAAAETLAQRALVWTHEQTGGSMSEEREPMTAEEVLVRIRSLVDNGAYASQADKIRELEADNLELAARVEEAERVAKALDDELDAFASLAAERLKGKPVETSTH
jgi:hypothetical protein